MSKLWWFEKMGFVHLLRVNPFGQELASLQPLPSGIVVACDADGNEIGQYPDMDTAKLIYE